MPNREPSRGEIYIGPSEAQDLRPIGDVLRGQAGVDSVLERLVNHRVDVPDGLGAERTVASALSLA